MHMHAPVSPASIPRPVTLHRAVRCGARPHPAPCHDPFLCLFLHICWPFIPSFKKVLCLPMAGTAREQRGRQGGTHNSTLCCACSQASTLVCPPLPPLSFRPRFSLLSRQRARQDVEHAFRLHQIAWHHRRPAGTPGGSGAARDAGGSSSRLQRSGWGSTESRAVAAVVVAAHSPDASRCRVAAAAAVPANPPLCRCTLSCACPSTFCAGPRGGLPGRHPSSQGLVFAREGSGPGREARRAVVGPWHCLTHLPR